MSYFGDSARVWINSIPLLEGYPGVPHAITSMEKLMLIAAWDTAEAHAVHPWSITNMCVSADTLGWAIGMPPDTPMFTDAYRRLRSIGWMGTGLDGSPVLPWGEPFSRSDHGYLYALEFDNGIVKFGRSCCAVRRRREHASAARKFGLCIVRAWASGPVDGTHAIEEHVLKRLRRRHVAAGGNEYFHGGFSTALLALGEDPEDHRG
jgi:hypothetical protein